MKLNLKLGKSYTTHRGKTVHDVMELQVLDNEGKVVGLLDYAQSVGLSGNGAATIDFSEILINGKSSKGSPHAL